MLDKKEIANLRELYYAPGGFQPLDELLRDYKDKFSADLDAGDVKQWLSGQYVNQINKRPGLKAYGANTRFNVEVPNRAQAVDIMEIVPDSKGLVLEVQVPPTAIDTVRQGLQADIRFTAFNSATTPVVEGVVEVIGSDRIPVPNAMPGQSVAEYYLGTIRPTQEGLERLGALKIQPGMTADVIIKTGERSFMSYFAKPLTDRLAKAFLDG